MNQEEKSPLDFNAAKHPTLYHYCTTATFLSIIESKSIWMSDINTMNDFGEMHWAYDMFIRAANLVIDEVGYSFIDTIDKVISAAQLYNLPLLSSFSTEGDVLSQWRAYADDGAGVSIGFDAKQLERLSVRVGSICYDEDIQLHHFKTMIRAMHEVHEGLPEKEKAEFLMEQVPILALDMGLIKNPGFQEEKEVRLIRAVNVERNGGEWTLKDVGGSGEKLSKKRLNISYRSSLNGGVVAYLALPLRGLGSNLIKNVIIGPKNPCSGNELSMALTAHGFRGATTLRSRSTYR
ncbi:DUF2971 domain-containing protein [Octadecabacter sp. G9-8]|uniref:DUF2971 domain-containing protein n=1 Tax=Octadecabacter dasysiphoniae TaxID=2909341 RepID=A0ABS9D1J8_9RHOB|nr:DUF2971 domain-containing protein [Octadecabacter dasysiphoniae]MCF2872949.1 DUF2971 domain-containing protein [Octadecabacter dasysiphoniae]